MVETCPRCGYPIKQSGFASAVTAIAGMFGLSPEKQNGNGAERQPRIIRTEPVATPTMEGNYIVPSLQSLTFGICATIAGCAVGHGASWPFWVELGVAAGSVSTILFWKVQTDRYDSLLYRIEEIFDKDLDGDGYKGPPPAPSPRQPDPPLTLVYGAANKPKRERFEIFVRGCKDNTAQNYWEGPPRNMPREEYIQFRDALIKLGWARWRSDKSNQPGWELLFSPDVVISGALRRAPRPTTSETA